MNRRAMSTVRTGLLALSLALLSTGCGSAAGEPPLAGAAMGGPFELVDGQGQTVRWSDFDGQYRIIYFGFTYCPDICPTDVQRMSQGLRMFERTEPKLGAEVQPIFIAVDRQRDTPEKLREFASNFHPRLLTLSGSTRQLDEAAENFGAFYSIGEKQPDGSYAVNHSTATVLYGRDGEPLAILPTEEGAEAVATELGRWVS